MTAITIEGLSKSYAADAKMAAVADLSLDIADNQFVTLLGPSGCGKTTTLRLVAGFLKPDTGTIHAGDRLVSSSQGVVPPEARGMGMVFQNYAVWPHKTVAENVAFGLKLRKLGAAEIKAAVDKTLALVNLTGLEGRYPSELSGGQQQRVALARSLVVEPGILLLDEPLSNLDAKLRERMRSELKDLQRRTGITFVYVTHDQAEALALSDRIAVIHGGRLQQFGTPEEVYGRPANRVVADFMGLVNLVPAEIAATSGTRARLALSPDLAFEALVPSGMSAGQKIEIALRPESITIAAPDTASPRAGTVSERTFLGNLVEYVVRCDNGPELRVQATPRVRLAPGDPIAITIDGSEITVLGPPSDKPASASAPR